MVLLHIMWKNIFLQSCNNIIPQSCCCRDTFLCCYFITDRPYQKIREINFCGYLKESLYENPLELIILWYEWHNCYNPSNIYQGGIAIIWSIFITYVLYGSICRDKYLGRNYYTGPRRYMREMATPIQGPFLKY